MNKLVLTGVAGRRGCYLRESLGKRAGERVSSGVVDVFGTLLANATYSKADL